MNKKSSVLEKEETSVVEQDSTALVNMSDFAEFAGAGLEDVTAQDINIPYIKFLQSSSHEIKKGDEKRILGAEEGDIVVTGINRLYKVDDNSLSTLNIAVVQKVTFMTEWGANGVGLQGHHSMAKKDQLGIKRTKNADGREILVLPNANEVVETDYLVCIAVPQDENETPYYCIIPAKQTQRSSVKQLYTQLMFDCQNALPTFAFLYNVGSRVKANDQYSWVVPTYTKMTSEQLDYVDARGILDINSPKGKQIFEICTSLYKTIKQMGIENFLQHTNLNDEYEEVSNTDTASEII